ncbi:MFS transporter [Gordonia soli]|uniref:Putative major facilitator superfamily transporter n=1 Tax=Gordonia soli NBRC 108243 TaxID=1223545 RepID=M0QLD5_9ACTN|nr:MFS transporter [Gordonia soli]GAC69465.1 putative major facilitator superfamily transporter [Gordonia soli NBRC 108243]
MTNIGAAASDIERRSWLPMVSLFFAQVLMSFNVAALPVSIGGMVDDFDVAPTTVGTTIVVYGLAVAALVMLGGKLGRRVGWVTIFRAVVISFGASAVLMIVSPSVGWAIAGQALAGASAAVIVPSLVALIAENYHGDQQATAIGSLGSARAISGVSAFFLGGSLGTLVGWRPVFGIVVALAVIVFAFSFTLRSDRGDRTVEIDVVAAIFIGAAIVLLTLGFNNLNSWGVFFADPKAPFDLLGVSPAPVMILAGLVLGQTFVLWTRQRVRADRVPLVDLTVLGSSRERAAVYAMFVVVALEAALNFTVPLYVQIVQGRTAFDTALAMMPFNLTVFVTAMLVVRFYKRYSPRVIGTFSFVLTTTALTWLAYVVNNNWETLPTILGLIVFGIGQGALVTLVFNVLVTAAPTRAAGDVGSIRGTTQNLASAVGTAVVGALLVTILGFTVASAVTAHPRIPDSLIDQVDLDNVNFVSNDALRETLARTDASPEQVDAAVEINEDVRLRTLQFGLLFLAGVSATAIIPATRLPNYRRNEIPDPSEI